MDHHRHFGYFTKLRKKCEALVTEQLTHCIGLVSACFGHCVLLSCCKPSKAQAVCDCCCRLSVLLFHRCFACCLLQFLCLVWFCFCSSFFWFFGGGNGSLRNAAAATDSAVYVGCSTQLAFSVCTHGKCDGLVFFFHLHGYGAAKQQQQQGAV